MIRKKRFLLDDKEDLKDKWASNKGELLTLTYDYSTLISEDLEYKEFIEVAVENFNRLGLARLVYQPVEMGVYLENCAIDRDYLKFKHRNHIVFNYYKPRNAQDKIGCKVNFNHFYNAEFSGFYTAFAPDNNTTLPPFAEIACNQQYRKFSRIFLGLIQHEFNHLFGVKHAHTIDNTNGIFPTRKPKPADIFNPGRGMPPLTTLLDVYNYGNYPVDNYTLISPFSIQHYPVDAYKEYRILNRTRISELLDSYKVSEEIKHNYFYLLDKYAGKYFVYTYQDLLALATAIYHIAPDSLVGNHFNFPNYYFVDGMYLAKEDKLKFIKMINTLKHVENFNYPLLQQENVTLMIKKDELFSKNLTDALKIVNLNNYPLSCSLQKHKVPNLVERLSVDYDCFIHGVLELVGEYEVPVIFSQHTNKWVYSLRLLVEDIKVKNRVLLGKSHAVYLMEEGLEDFYIDLVDTCQAVAYPIEKRLSCGWVNSTLESYIPVQHCMFLVEDTTERNLSFVFLNGEANKTCLVSFLLDVNASLANLSGRKVSREVPFLAQRQTKHAKPSSSLGMQVNYCITIPFAQGVLEGAVDSTSLHAYVKSGLKVLPRVALWYLDYFELLNFSLIAGASFLEGTIKNSLKNKATVPAEKFISLMLFLSITELEYGFSNLWTLTGQPQFLPELTDKFNQLFLQWYFLPMMKTLGYMLTVNLINLCLPSTPSVQENKVKSVAPLLHHENEVVSEKSIPTKSSFVAAMQDAYQTVFSRKTFKLFAFFKVNPQQAQEVSNSDELSIGLRQA